MDNITNSVLAITEASVKLLINNATDQGVDPLKFGFVDYILFSLMLGFSAIIGIYFGFFGKQDTTEDYLMGGKTMGIFPISMSLVASMVSGITLLGVPSDVYQNGAAYWLSIISISIVCVIISYVYMPVFHKLQLTTTYEYLKLRFDGNIRVFASLLFALMSLLYVPIVIYIPALAFAQVSGMDLYLITIIICVICIFYTCFGGLKAVVWSDTLQIIVMVGSMMTVFYLGLTTAGGFGAVWQKALERERLEVFQMDPDPTIRDSFWAVLVGVTVGWTSYAGVNQGCVQRFLALPTLSDVRKSLIIFGLGLALFVSVSVFTGLIMHAMYADCDPLTLGLVSRPDQLLPYHIIDVASQMHGLPGLFIAGVVGASLSTLSTCLNTLAGTIYEDFLSPFMPKGTTEKTASNIMKIIVVVVGLICLGLVFVIQHLGGVLQLSISFGGVTSGPLLGLFTLGMLFPSANTKGALYGGIGALMIQCWIVFGAQIHIARGNIRTIPKPLSIDNCLFPANITGLDYNPMYEMEMNDQEVPFFLYRISFYYYTLIGTVVTIVIGLVVSWITKDEDEPEVDRDLLSPVIYWMLPKTKSKGEYYVSEKTYQIVLDLDKKLEKQ